MKQLKPLLDLLRHTRAHGGIGEQRMVDKYLLPYAPTTFVDPDTQEILAWVIEVGGPVIDKGVEPILFSCHVDTVHSIKAPVTQTIMYDKGLSLIYKEDDMPLGADNAAGMWLCLEMIAAGVPGAYIFHRGEERGGIGSRGMADHHYPWLSRFNYAIAFDRRGTGDIITEMMCGVTCSREFALALAAKLNMAPGVPLAYRPDDTGSFTDTANYRRIIPECTNISVGYENEHGPSEVLDVEHLLLLRDALVFAFKQGGTDLPVVRDKDAEDVWDTLYPCSYPFDSAPGVGPYDATSVMDMSYSELVRWAESAHPEDIAELLVTLATERVC